MSVIICGHLYTLYTDYQDDKKPRSDFLEHFRSKVLKEKADSTDLILAGDYLYSALPLYRDFFYEHFTKEVEKQYTIHYLPATHELKGVNYSEGIKPSSFWFKFIRDSTLFSGLSYYADTGQETFESHKLKIDKNITHQLLKRWEDNASLKKVLILPDLRWAIGKPENSEEILNLVTKADLTIVGDNEYSFHNYGWMKVQGSKVVMTGLPYGLKKEFGGMGSYVVIKGLDLNSELDVQVKPFNIGNGLSKIYEQDWDKVVKRKQGFSERIKNKIKRRFFK